MNLVLAIKADNPKEFSHKTIAQWEDSVYNYLSSHKNSCGTHLALIIRKYTRSPGDM